MPFINSKVSVKISQEQEQELKLRLGPYGIHRRNDIREP